MYNRYIPQGDGTYRRKAMPEPPNAPPRPSHKPPEPAPVPQSCPPVPPRRPPRPCKQEPSMPIGSFLKQLLPGDFGTEDLLVVLLLLLMAGDCPEKQNSALLTLALYLFL